MSTSPELTFREVTRDSWADFEKLFECRGSPGYCWCMVWRATSAEAKDSDRASRKKSMHARVTDGTHVGLLGYEGHEPVAWCSVEPRRTFARHLSKADEDDSIWSITCFFVIRRLRGLGLTKQLLAAAVSHARKHGAKIVEAYGVDPDSPSYRFMGFVPMFEEAGFNELARDGTRRHVMQKKLTGRSGRKTRSQPREGKATA